MILKFTKEDIINGFEYHYGSHNTRMNFGIIDCLNELNKFINNELIDCRSFTESRTLIADMNPAKIDEIVCCANNEEYDLSLKKFLSSLKESKDFSRVITNHLLKEYDPNLFKEELKKSLEYHKLRMDLESIEKSEQVIKKVKI